MPPKQSNLPISGEHVRKYYQDIASTQEFHIARNELGIAYHHNIERAPTDEAKKRAVRAMSRRVIANTADLLGNKQHEYKYPWVDSSYNSMLSTLPDFSEGVRRLDENIGNRRDAKALVIPYNHAVKQLIDEHQSISPYQFNEMVKNTLFINGYGDDLYQHVRRRTIPGMTHELAANTNLFYLPDNPDILDTTVEHELKGIDAILDYTDGTLITLDFKKSQAAALAAQSKHLQWRQDHNIIEPDNHLIIASGYSGDDFVKDKIGRVTEEARLREQYRYDALIENKHQELLRAKQFLDNLT